jgi:hypothetical protein
VQHHAAQIRYAGAELAPIDLARSGKNPLTELRT